MTIEFSKIKSLFDPEIWDVAYLSEENIDRISNYPIKIKTHLRGYDLTEQNLHKTIRNGIILAKHSVDSNDYAIYDDSFEILSREFPENKFVQTYLNFKEAALLAGFGYRAKNSLVYNRKFGFQCKLSAYMFAPEIINPEVLKPTNKELLNLCEGCFDCINNCPVKAIHEDWVDAKKCDNFIGVGNHPKIPSVKWFWYEKMNPNVSRETVESWNSFESLPKFEWGQGVDGYYESCEDGLKKDGKPIPIPHCNECQLQPRCSKAPINKSTA